MSSGQEEIQIDDLESPILSEAERDLIRLAEKTHVSLSANSIWSTAQELTGLEEPESAEIVSRLKGSLETVEFDSNSTQFLRVATYYRSLKFVIERLKMHQILRDNPQINDIEISSPVIITGPPRSATTHLQGILSADCRIQSLSHSMAENKVQAYLSKDMLDLNKQANVFLESSSTSEDVLPHLDAMVSIGADDVVEDDVLWAPNFPCGQDELIRPIPSPYRYMSQDHTPHYEYMKTMLKVIQWQYGGSDQWVLKSPTHAFHIKSLLDVFPDATIVLTYRDPIQVIQSVATMVFYASRLSYKQFDAYAGILAWSNQIEELIRCILQARKIIPAKQLVEVPFGDFINDRESKVKEIYRKAGIELTGAQYARAMRYMSESSKSIKKKVHYDLHKMFRITPGFLRDRFSFYYDLFGLQ